MIPVEAGAVKLSQRPKSYKKSVERYEAILTAAVEVFDEKGYPGAGLEAIARSAGLLKSSLYHYIDTKEDLLFEIMRRGHERGLQYNIESADEEALAPPERLAAFVRRWTNGRRRNPPEYRVIQSDFRYLTGDRREVIRQMRRTIAQFPARIIADGQRLGYFAPQHDPRLALDFVTQVIVSEYPSSAERDDQAFARVVEWYVHVVLSSLMTAPSALSAARTSSAGPLFSEK